jgi:hypothetical protein
MKKILVSFVLLGVILLACSKDEPVNFEAFNPEAFAYDLGDLWEVNATVRARGFMQNKDDETNQFSASIEYVVDLRKPSGEVESNKFKFTYEPVNDEKFIDVGLDAQFELPSTYEEGIYTVMFKITDLNSGKETSTIAEFNLSK